MVHFSIEIYQKNYMFLGFYLPWKFQFINTKKSKTEKSHIFMNPKK